MTHWRWKRLELKRSLMKNDLSVKFMAFIFVEINRAFPSVKNKQNERNQFKIFYDQRN